MHVWKADQPMVALLLRTMPFLQVCPITLSLFQDPVCNALGQVYERAALQRHLLQVGPVHAPQQGVPAAEYVSAAPPNSM